MKELPHTLPVPVINLFFIIGLLSALSFRSLMAVKELWPEFFRPVWYLGIIGYIVFFSYRYLISLKRKKAISDYNLITKVEQNELSSDDRRAIAYLLASIEKSKENLNYLFIFATSALAILLDILI